MFTISNKEAATSNPDRTLCGPPGPRLKAYRKSDPIRGQLKVQSCQKNSLSSDSGNRCLKYYQESNLSSVSCNRCPESHLRIGHNSCLTRSLPTGTTIMTTFEKDLSLTRNPLTGLQTRMAATTTSQEVTATRTDPGRATTTEPQG